MADATGATPVDLTGTWKLAKSEKFDEYLKAVGLGMARRKLIQSASPTVEIKQNGDEFKIITKTGARSREATFKVGVEYTETSPMLGDNAQRVLAEWSGSKLVQRVLLAPGDDTPKSFEREIVDGELVLTLRRGDLVAKRYFKKI